MAQTGRPTDYHPGMIDTLLAAAEGDTLGAATIPDIAKVLGVARATVYLWIQEHKEFMDAIVRVRTITDAAVVSALRKRATGFDYTETSTTTKEGVNKEGAAVSEVSETVKHMTVVPDTAAAVFWLKNRDPEQWSDKTKVEVSGDFVEQVEAILKAKQKAHDAG